MTSIATEGGRLETEVGTLLEEASALQITEAKHQASTARQAYHSARTLIIALLIIGTALSVGLAILTARSIFTTISGTYGLVVAWIAVILVFVGVVLYQFVSALRG